MKIEVTAFELVVLAAYVFDIGIGLAEVPNHVVWMPDHVIRSIQVACGEHFEFSGRNFEGD